MIAHLTLRQMTSRLSPLNRVSDRLPSLSLLVGACLLVVTLLGPSAEAQTPRLGLRAGPAFGFLSDSAVPFTGGSDLTNANPRLDLHGGVFLTFPLTDSFALQPELLYTRKGGHFSQPLSERYSVERYQLSYIQGLLLGRRALPVRGRLSAHVVAGLSLDIALSGTVRRNTRTAKGDMDARLDLVDAGSLRRWDVGLVVGAGLGYAVGATSRLTLSLRYNPGLRGVFSDDAAALPPITDPAVFPLSAPLPNLRHDLVSATLSYTTPLKSFW